MILPWPLTTSTELAQVLRPGGHLRPDSALRTLRENGLAAEPISVVPRSGRGARGRVVWYSSLMVDVARLLRMRDTEIAAAVHNAATPLAAHRSARFVAERLLDAGPEPDPAQVDADTGAALTRLALLTAAAREKHLASLGIESFVGRVADVSGQVALVVADDGRTLPIPSPTTPSLWAEALVSVDTEFLAGGATTVWVRPAFDSEADPNERVPGGPHLLTPAERERLARPVAAR